MYILSIEEMRVLEAQADAKGHSYAQMMQLAGTGLAQVVMDWLPEQGATVIGLVGPGNNGGDALVALSELQRQGISTSAVVYFRDRKPDSVQDDYLAAGGVLLENLPVERLSTPGWVILDGLLGTGTRLPLRVKMRELLEDIHRKIQPNRANGLVVAVDCPSGMDCDTGDAPDCVLAADLTVCMAAVKQGLLKMPARRLTGEIVGVNIGLDAVIPGWQSGRVCRADDADVAAMLPPRPSDGHKGTFGTAMVVGGMVQYTGAPLLAAKAACAVGTGLVQVAVPESLHQVLAGHLPEATWLLLPEVRGGMSADGAQLVQRKLPGVDALLVGPGLGLDENVKRFIRQLFLRQANSIEGLGFLINRSGENTGSGVIPPLVVDADGLKCLAEIPDWYQLIPPGSILTPHPGEMSILTGLPVKEIQKDRIDVVKKFAAEWGQIVVLKGAGTIVAAPDGRVTLIDVQTSALAHAGSGDVLAGLTVGLLAQGIRSYDAAVTAAYLHGQAGLLAAQIKGSPASVLPSDLILHLGDILGRFWPPDD